MSLYLKLQNATSEEDVKDAYIKALGLKNYQKNLINIQTKEIGEGFLGAVYGGDDLLTRNALKKRNSAGDVPPVSFDDFEIAYKALTEKIRPLVWELGFLR